MKQPVRWHRSSTGEAWSPFEGGAERPLRVTFHTSSFDGLPGDEKSAVELLRELVVLAIREVGQSKRHPPLEGFDTEPGTLPQIKVDMSAAGHIGGAELWESDASRQWSAMPPYPDALGGPIAARMIGRNPDDTEDIETRAMLGELLIARAHCAVKSDIFITASPSLVERRNHRLLREANIRTPTEAAEIVGLFLRSRKHYVFAVKQGTPHSLTRSGFYSALVHHRLPSIWRYMIACEAVQKIHENEIFNLAYSVLLRCIRAPGTRSGNSSIFGRVPRPETR